ncbi:71_t:CDS:2, partial [Diversispora eburnea]
MTAFGNLSRLLFMTLQVTLRPTISSTTHGPHSSTEAINQILNGSQSEIILSVNITDPVNKLGTPNFTHLDKSIAEQAEGDPKGSWPPEPTNITYTATATELQKLLQEGVILKKIHQTLECNQEDNSFINNFIHTSMELEKHSKDPREKVYHKLIREVFNIKILYKASKRDGHMTQAEFYKNRIEKCIHEFLSHIGGGKKEWLSRGAVKALRLSTTSQKILDLLDMAEYKGLKIP